MKDPLGLRQEVVSSVVLANPGKGVEWLAAKCGMDVERFKRFVAREEFQKCLMERRERVCAEIFREAQIANHQLHLKALEKAHDSLVDMENSDLIKLIDVTAKNSGIQKEKQQQISVNNNFVVKWADDDKVVSDQ